MYCNECENEIEDGVDFCPECGNRISCDVEILSLQSVKDKKEEPYS